MALCVQTTPGVPSYLQSVVVASVDLPSCAAACPAGAACEVVGQPVPPSLEPAAVVEAFSEGFLIAIVPLLAAFGAAMIVQAVKRF